LKLPALEIVVGLVGVEPGDLGVEAMESEEHHQGLHWKEL